jgi:hypothetical protein
MTTRKQMAARRRFAAMVRKRAKKLRAEKIKRLRAELRRLKRK